MTSDHTDWMADAKAEGQVTSILSTKASKVSHANWSQTDPSALEHTEDCPKAAQNLAKCAYNLRSEEAEVDFQEVWTRMGRELRNAGIPAAMIKEDQAMTADWIINTERQKRKRKNRRRRRKKARRAEKKAREAEKRAVEALTAANVSVPEAMGIEAAASGIAIINKNENFGDLENVGTILSPTKPSRTFTQTKQTDIAEKAIEIPARPKMSLEQRLTDTDPTGKPVVPQLQMEVHATTAWPSADEPKIAKNQLVDNGVPNSGKSDGKAIKPCADTMSTISGPSGTPISRLLPPGANDGKPIPRCKPCPCGSRRKYKKCCDKVERPQCLDTIAEREGAPVVHHDNPQNSIED